MTDALSVEVLRRVRPEAVRVVLDDGSERVLTPQRHHRKWMRVTETVEDLPWQRVELLRGGEVARVLAAPTPPQEVDAAAYPPPPPPSSLSAEVAGVVAAQQLVLNMVQGAQGPLLDALVRMAEQNSKRFTSLENSLSKTHELLRDVLQDAVTARLDAADAEAEAATKAADDGSTQALKELAAAVAMQHMAKNGTPNA
jgi:hypothetical protein